MSGKNQALTSMSDDGDMSFGSLWSRSAVFKILLIACGVFVVAFVITLIVLLVKSSSQQADIDSLEASNAACRANEEKLTQDIAALNEQLSTSSKTIANLTTTVNTLTAVNADLRSQLNQSGADLNRTKQLMFYWEIGAGVGGAIGLSTGGYSAYQSYRIKYWTNLYNQCSTSLSDANKRINERDREISELNNKIYELNNQFTTITNRAHTTIMPAAVDTFALKKKGKNLKFTECYSSYSLSRCNQQDFMTKCKSDGTAVSTYIVFNTDKSHFGVFINEALPTALDSPIKDNKAFVFIDEKLITGDARTDYTIFNFPTNGFINIGNGEIVVAPSSTTSTTVTVSEGTAFSITEKYGASSQFTVTSIVAYKITEP